MAEQGSSRRSQSESGHILDRLAALEKIVSHDMVADVLRSCAKVNGRACKLTHEVMMWVVLGMGLLTHLPVRQVFRHCRRRRADETTPARSSLCAGRQRLGSEPLKQLFENVVRPLASPDTPGAFYRGLRLTAIDGTVLDVPDCDALQHFGRSSGSRGEGPFPQVRKVSLVEVGTHVELDFVFGGWGDSEQKLVTQLWGSIPDDALLLEDRGFFSFESWKELHTKHKLLVRIQKSMVFKPVKRLSDGSFLAKVYANSWNRQNDRHGILVRVIEYTLDDPQRTGDGEVHRLMTNLLDADECPALELIMLYHERWEIEIVFDEQKTHQDPCRAEKTTNLRSETVEGITQELYALSLGHFVVRAMMFDAAESTGIDVDRLSFTGCFRILQCRLPEYDARGGASLAEWYDGLLSEFCEENIGDRRNRINPRVIKRKMSRWLKARPHHRKLPPCKEPPNPSSAGLRGQNWSRWDRGFWVLRGCHECHAGRTSRSSGSRLPVRSRTVGSRRQAPRGGWAATA